ncbi:MAG: hypothetical protein K6B75_04990 [Lachnospiraceae bacterium]|nr:hypothetical protein [Lachnospiraceae bacterium]
MNIVYFGTDVYLSTFLYMAKNHNIMMLYTYHNDEDYFTEYGVVKAAKELGIPVSYGKITEDEVKDLFTNKGCDLFFSAEYAYIIPVPEDIKNFRGVNVHAALLPHGRGYYPIESGMVRGDEYFGVTMHVLAPKIDRGDIVFQHKVKRTKDMDSVDIYLDNAVYVLQMAKDLLADVDGTLKGAYPQGAIEPYWKRPEISLLTLNHDMSCDEALELYAKFNGMTEVVIDGKCYYVSSIMKGKTKVLEDAVFIAVNKCIYKAKDGNLRLDLIEKTV